MFRSLPLIGHEQITPDYKEMLTYAFSPIEGCSQLWQNAVIKRHSCSKINEDSSCLITTVWPNPPAIFTQGKSTWLYRLKYSYKLSLSFYFLAVGVAHTGQVLAMEFSETGYNLISYGSDETVRLWDTFSGNLSLFWTYYNNCVMPNKSAKTSGYPVQDMTIHICHFQTSRRSCEFWQ